MRIQNSIDEEAVLIEKIINHPIREEDDEGEHSHSGSESRPPSRIVEGEIANNGILRMSPKSQQLFFESLNKIYQEQD